MYIEFSYLFSQFLTGYECAYTCHYFFLRELNPQPLVHSVHTKLSSSVSKKVHTHTNTHTNKQPLTPCGRRVGKLATMLCSTTQYCQPSALPTNYALSRRSLWSMITVQQRLYTFHSLIMLLLLLFYYSFYSFLLFFSLSLNASAIYIHILIVMRSFKFRKVNFCCLALIECFLCTYICTQQL